MHRLRVWGGFVLAFAGCSGAAAKNAAVVPSSSSSIVVPRNASLAQVAEAIAAAATAGDQHGDCGFFWGDLAAEAKEAGRAVELSWGERPIAGWLVCNAAAEQAVQDPRVHQVGLIAWRDGRLHVAHPSDVSASVPLERPAGAPEAAIGLFMGGDGPARPVLVRLRDDVPRSFLVAAWMVEAK